VTTTTRALACLAVCLAALALAGPVCQACSIPVFRYALERWPAEPYEAVVLHRGPLAPAEQAALDVLRKTAEGNAALTNLQVRTVDLAGPDSKQAEALLKGGEAGALPRLIVRYPDSLRIQEHAWSGALTTANIQALVDSPARREIVRRLAGGDCAVWLLIECGDRAQDDAAAKVLRDQLKKLENVLELPPQMDADAFGDGPPEPKGDGGADPDAVTLPKLKVAFSSLRVAQTDPAEKLFLDTLLGLDPELRKEGKPIALAVFGQGRALPALLGDGINPENIADVCTFVVGPCSCQVKAMNPGWDVLMTADWFGALDGQVVKDPEPPALTGSVAAALPKAAPTEASSGPASDAAPAAAGGLLLRNVLLAAAAGAALLAIASFAVLRRGGMPREPR